MSDEVNAAELEGTPTQEGTVSADAELSTKGQPEAGASETGGEPTGVEGLPEDWTPELLADRYKSYQELQREFGERNEAFKTLEGQFTPYGGVDKLLETAHYLQGNPRFQEWAKEEQERSYYGDTQQDLTDENRQAVEIVERIVNQRVEQALKDRVAPLENGYKEKSLAENFGKMDGIYGSDWREQQNSMTKLAESLPKSVQDNPSLEDIQDLYWNSLRRDGSGKFEAMQAKMYQKKLESTKSKSTEKPSSVPTGRLGQKISSMAEAFNVAKEG